MNIVPLTIAISLCLVFTFVVFFVREQVAARVNSNEHDSLLPLAEERPRLAPTRAASAATPTTHEHDHAEDDGCGCRDGSRPPCVGCLKNHA
jgi:hypothetical protein